MKNLFLTKTRWLVTIILLTALGIGNAWGAIAYGTYVEASALESGAHYIFTGVKNSTTYTISNVNNTNNRKTTSVNINNGSITVASNSTVCTFTLGGSSNAWTWCADNYLVNSQVTTNCYLRATSSGSNSLGLNSNNLDDNARWTMGAFSSGTATMVANGTYSRKKVRFNPNGKDAAIFGAYATNTTTGTDVKFYRKAVQGASNNTNYGTVSVAGDVITATPESGYQVSTSNPYTISPTGKATVSQSGNVFTLTNVSAVVTLTVNFEAAAPSCDKSVTINAGTNTNCTFTLSKSGVQASCDGVSTTVSITPNTGYGKNPSVTQSGASAAPTISGSGNSWTVAYGANTTGTSTINVSCSANDYLILFDEEGATTSGDPGIDVTYDSNENLTSAITIPIKTGWTFGGYYTAKNGGGTQIIDASGNVIASAGGGSTYTDASKNWKYADDITLYAKWTCTVTWSVNGLTNVYSTQTVTYNSSGCKVASVPGPPSPASYCGDVFAGWSRKSAGSESKTTSYYNDLFTNVAGSPELKTVGDVTFYAVFADYTE